MTRTNYRISDIPNRFNWVELKHFIQYLDAGSALKSELDPDSAAWEGNRRLPMLIADLIDVVNAFRVEAANKGREKGKPKAKPIKPYPRPGVKSKERHIGSKPIPVSKFKAWWRETGEKHANVTKQSRKAVK